MMYLCKLINSNFPTTIGEWRTKQCVKMEVPEAVLFTPSAANGNNSWFVTISNQSVINSDKNIT